MNIKINNKKEITQNQIDLILNQPILLNPIIELVLSDVDKFNEFNQLEEDDFMPDEDSLEMKRSVRSKNKLHLANNNNNRPYCRAHFEWLFKQDDPDNDLDLFNMFDKENKKQLNLTKLKKVLRLKNKLVDFCLWMKQVFNYEESDFDPVSLIKIFIVNYENTMPVPIKIEEVLDTRLKNNLLKMKSSTSDLCINRTEIIRNIKPKTKILKRNDKWYLPKKQWFKNK